MSAATLIRHHDNCISRTPGPNAIYCDCRTLYMIEARMSLITSITTAEAERDAALATIERVRAVCAEENARIARIEAARIANPGSALNPLTFVGIVSTSKILEALDGAP